MKPFADERRPFTPERRPFVGERKHFVLGIRPFASERRPYENKRSTFTTERRTFMRVMLYFMHEMLSFAHEIKHYSAEPRHFAKKQSRSDANMLILWPNTCISTQKRPFAAQCRKSCVRGGLSSVARPRRRIRPDLIAPSRETAPPPKAPQPPLRRIFMGQHKPRDRHPLTSDQTSSPPTRRKTRYNPCRPRRVALNSNDIQQIAQCEPKPMSSAAIRWRD